MQQSISRGVEADLVALFFAVHIVILPRLQKHFFSGKKGENCFLTYSGTMRKGAEGGTGPGPPPDDGRGRQGEEDEEETDSYVEPHRVKRCHEDQVCIAIILLTCQSRAPQILFISVCPSTCRRWPPAKAAVTDWAAAAVQR